VFAPRFARLGAGCDIAERAPPHLLVELGELPANGHRALGPARCQQFTQQTAHPVGGLEDYDRAFGLGRDGGQAFGPPAALGRQEPLEAPPFRG
jgi:hypothetical protein